MGSIETNRVRRIGQGFCGTVWAPPLGSTNTSAIKREDGGPGRSVANDYAMHQKALEGMSASGARVCVPGCHRYVSKDDSIWWDDHLGQFPGDFQQPCNALVTNRIPPLSKSTRERLIDMYCPGKLQTAIKSSEPDEDCLIRPYLGRKRHLVQNSRFTAFSLRNYPLHLDQVEELGLDAKLYARIMAETLAVLYWKCRIDANDVEFVLAPLREDKPACAIIIPQSPNLEEHTVWLLDFDCCRDMPMDEGGVEQAVAAFYRNDPFYPYPESDKTMGQTLWHEFKYCFLEVSAVLLGQDSPESCLPALWVRLVEERVQKLS